LSTLIEEELLPVMAAINNVMKMTHNIYK